MTPVTADTRTEWTTRLAQALVQVGYETESNLAPLVAESRATDQSLAYLLISRNLALPGVVVGALAQLAQLPAVDLAALTPEPRGPRGHAATPWPSSTGPWRCSSTATCWSVAFAEPPSQRGRRRAGRPGSATGSLRCWPTRSSSPSSLGSRNGSVPPSRTCTRLAAGRIPSVRAPTSPWPRRRSSSCSNRDPGSGGERQHAAAHRRPAALRRVGRRVGPPPDGGACPAPSGSTVPCAPSRVARRSTTRPSGTWSSASCRPRSGSGSRRSTSSTRRTPSPASVGSVSTSSLQRGTVAAALRPIPHEMPEFDQPRASRLDQGVHRPAARPGAGDRPDRLGQVDDPGVADRHHQPDQAAAHRDRRGPDRVPPRPQAVDHHPAGDRRGHRLVLRGAAPGPAPGPRRHPGRRAPRPRDHLDGPDRRRDRPPGVRHPAHPGRAPDHRPDHRRVPHQAAGADPGHAGRHPRGCGHPAADRRPPTAPAGCRAPRSWCARRPSGT